MFFFFQEIINHIEKVFPIISQTVYNKIQIQLIQYNKESKRVLKTDQLNLTVNKIESKRAIFAKYFMIF